MVGIIADGANARQELRMILLARVAAPFTIEVVSLGVRSPHGSGRTRSLFDALIPYLGGKRKLCPIIFREIDRVLPREYWHRLTLLDGFLGGGSVSLYGKAQGLAVMGTDIAARSITIGDALIANNHVKLTRADLSRVLATPLEGTTPNAMTLVPAVFTENVGAILDKLLHAAARTPIQAKAALFRLLAIRVGLLAHPMSQIRPGTAHRATTGEWEAITSSCLKHYVDALRLDTMDELWRLARKINAGVFEGHGRVIQADVLEVLASIEADVAYFDPPYSGVMSYEKEYRVIDQLLEGTTRPTSPFTARDGASQIDTLLERAQHIPVWILSFGNAVAGLDELEAKMSRLGRQTKAIAIRYQHLPAVATVEKKAGNLEYLLIGIDPRSTLPLRFEGAREEVAV